MDDNDNPQLLRVYRATVQRVAFTASSLSAAASFVIVAPLKQIVMVYHGRDSSLEDCEISNELAKEIKSEEVCRKGTPGQKSKSEPPLRAGAESRNEVLSFTEGASIPSDILATFLDLFWLTTEEYRFRCKVVNNTKNDVKTFHIIERIENSTSSRFRLRKLGTCLVDRTGAIPLMPFPTYHPKKMGLLIVGDQYDLWIGESVSKDAQQSAKQLVTGLMNASVPLGEGITKRENGLFDGVFYDAPLRIQHQGYEDAGFRSHFDSSVEFIAQPGRNPFVYIRDKNSRELYCTPEANCTDVFSWINWVVPAGAGAGGGAGGAGGGGGGGGATGGATGPQTPNRRGYGDDALPSARTPY